MLTDYFKISFKNLRHRGVRSWLTLLGIFIGIVAVISLISLGNALKVAVTNQFGISNTEVITVQAGGINMGPPGSGASKSLTTDDVDRLGKLSSVKLAVGRIITNGKLEYNNKVIFGYAADIPSGEKGKFVYDEINAKAVAGRLLKDGDTNKVVLGYNFYVDKVGVGKPVVPGNSVLIQDKKFEVVGILDKKGSFIYDNIVLMNTNELKDLMNYGKRVDLIAVQPVDSADLNKTAQDVEKEMRKIRDVKEGEEDFSVTTPEASLRQINNILGGIQAFIVIIAFISIIVGAVGIINTMRTSVLERRKEIGIMKAVGARNSQIFLQFFIESSLLGLVGGIAGIIVGSLIGVMGAYGINNFLGASVKPTINFVLIFVTLIGSFLIGGLSGITPALEAAKQNPVEALRG